MKMNFADFEGQGKDHVLDKQEASALQNSYKMQNKNKWRGDL